MFGENLNVFMVGGCVRDRALMGFGCMEEAPIKDIDFAVEAASFDTMMAELEMLGFDIFKSDPDFVTLRARFPRSAGWTEWLLDQDLPLGLTADFVLCRKDGVYLDGRRPETVEAGTIYDDLARRDFTVNAIAQHHEAGLLDPHGGIGDLNDGRLRFVGDPIARVTEDGLRALRGLRFMVTHGLTPDRAAQAMFKSAIARDAIAQQHDQRVFEEIEKMFRWDTLASIEILTTYQMLPVVFPKAGSMWLRPTTKER